MKNDPRRIERISESPCSKCGKIVECSNRIRSNYRIGEIRDSVFGNRNFDYHDCGIWIALSAPDMVEVDDEL